jgi:hypothetical protein
MKMAERVPAGFAYLVEHVRAGRVIERELVHNLMPTEGLNYALSAALTGGAQVSAWYIGLFEGNYTPQASDTAATFPGLATETTAYSGSVRLPWTYSAVAAGATNNSASKAEFTASATKTIYGGFLSSSSVRGGTTGTLLSVVRFSSPKTVDSGDILRITAGFTLTSL